MKRKIALLLLTILVLVSASPGFTPSVSSNAAKGRSPRVVSGGSNLVLPLVTTLSVDRADDTAAASACTAAANDCSLRGAIRKANTTPGPDPVVVNLQPATTYNLTLSNATQENAAATGDLDITTSAHPVTIEGGGPATIIDATALNGGGRRDRVFHVTGSNVMAILRNLTIRNGQAGDNGTAGTSTNPTAQNTHREGGGILNSGGSLTLEKVVVQSCLAVGKGDSLINESTTLDAAGGGLASRGGTANVIILNSTFTSNAATGGNGGDFNNGRGSGAQGGSIYFEGGTLHIDGSRIEKSSAIGGNGGNQDQSGQTNGGIGGMAQGGGVYVGGGSAGINNTTFKSTVAIGGNSGTAGNGANFAGGADGGGLYSLGNVKVLNSTFHLAGATGGNGGNAFGPNCFGGHVGGDGGPARGGAIFADGGTMVINTATFANNFANGGNGGNGGQTNGGLNCGQHGAGGLAHGAAIANNNAATVNITHGTISLNNATAGNTGVNQGGANKPPRPKAEGAGGGIRVGPASVTLENTIIAGNTAANGLGDPAGAPVPGPNVDGTVISNGHNLLGVATDAGGFTGSGDLTGANPMLAALANNGGPTETMALSAGSPAIDKGVAVGAAFDQRGQSRTFDDPGTANAPTSDGTDIGAFEHQTRRTRCDLCCPNNITVQNDRGRKGAVVSYKLPSADGCGRIKCAPPSGSFFPLGETIVTCVTSTGPECSFKVTVTGPQIQNPKE